MADLGGARTETMPIGCKRGCAVAATSSVPGPLGDPRQAGMSSQARRIAGCLQGPRHRVRSPVSAVLLTCNYSIAMKCGIVALDQVITNVMSTMG